MASLQAEGTSTQARSCRRKQKRRHVAKLAVLPSHTPIPADVWDQWREIHYLSRQLHALCTRMEAIALKYAGADDDGCEFGFGPIAAQDLAEAASTAAREFLNVTDTIQGRL